MSNGQAVSLRSQIYIGSTVAVAILFVLTSLYFVDVDLSRSVTVTAALLTLLSFIFERGINFPLLVQGSSSFSTVTYMAMIFLLPFPLPALLGAPIVLANDLWERKPVRSLLFNPANYALTFGVSGLVWHLYSNGRSLAEIPATPLSFGVILVVIALFYSINVFLLNGALSIINRRPFFYLWASQELEYMFPYITLQVIGLIFALVWATAPVILPFLIVPAVTTYLAFETIKRLQRQTQEAMIAMADAIDARDPYTAQHSQRVTELAISIAETYGLKAREIDRIELAARVHDLGKIGISDTVLNKPGKLDEHEWALMQSHSSIGEQLLSPYRQFKHEAEIVRSHHERWDGKGYPDGLRGAAVPIGARIISVADAFDAMTSDRPYRAALTVRQAIEEIRKGAVTQFDPQVVASFLQVMEERSKVTPLHVVANEEEEQQPQWYSSAP